MRASKRLLILPAVAALLLAGYLSVLAQPSPSDGGGQLGSVTGQRWAVLVGVNQYAELNNLAYCVADAKALRDRLVKAGFPERNVFLLVDGAEDSGALPFRRNIQREIAGVLQSAEEDDLVLISFSGHGMHIDGKSYFCPSDASADSPETTMIPLDLIYRQLEQSAAGQKILLVDACRNDPRPIGPRTLEEKKEYQRSLERLGEQLRRPPEGTAVLSSSAPGQISWEDPKLGHGVFLYYVLEGLDGKAADAEGQVSLLDLWRYANRQTRSFVLHHRRGYVQTPELRGAITGDMVLARIPMRVDPPKPPPPLAVAPFSAQQARRHQDAWAEHLGQPREIENSIGMKLVLIPPGEFMMGSPEDEEGRWDDEGPQHRVRITKPIYFGAHQVTVGAFRRFVSDTGYKTEAERDGEGGWGWNEAEGKLEGRDPKYHWRNPGFSQTDDHPVVNVSWNDAVAFCEWLSGKEGREYRLPTEAEWEYACRAGTTTRYYHGDDAEGLAQVGNVADAEAKKKFPRWTTISASDGYVFTAPVGRFRANGFGLYDMHGNVWEWCSDWYDAKYYANSPVDDPQGPTSGSGRVLRGGSWLNDPGRCRSASRGRGTPDSRHSYPGFRVAWSSVDESSK